MKPRFSRSPLHDFYAKFNLVCLIWTFRTTRKFLIHPFHKHLITHFQSAGGILLPETGKKLNEGEVVAIGPGAQTKEGKTLPMSVSVGDRVLLPEYGGHTVKVGDEELFLYRDEDILGKFQ